MDLPARYSCHTSLVSLYYFGFPRVASGIEDTRRSYEQRGSSAVWAFLGITRLDNILRLIVAIAPFSQALKQRSATSRSERRS